MADEIAAPPTPDQAETEQSKSDRKKADKKRKQRVELAGAIVIGIAAILTAIATFNGGDADGTVEKRNTDGIAWTLIANSFYNDANAQRLVERDWIFTFIAEAANDTEAADILLAAMPDDVYALADDWLIANESGFLNPQNELIDDPFSEDYAAADGLLSVFYENLGDEWDLLAECAFFDSAVAAVQGDSYGLSTVFLAIALVVGGIAALLTRKAAQIIVITIALFSLALGSFELVTAGDIENSTAVAAANFFTDDNGNQFIETDEFGVPNDIPGAVAIAEERCPAR